MNYIYKNGELYHFGVKGMKWGVRRKRNNQTKANTKKSIPKHVKSAAIIAAGLAVSYAGAKFAASPRARSAMAKVLRDIGSKKTSDLDMFKGFKIVGKDGSPLSPDAIQRLKDLGIT